MPKEYTFATKHYLTDDLYEVALKEPMNQMVATRWENISTQPSICEHSSTPTQLVLSWGKEIMN